VDLKFVAGGVLCCVGFVSDPQDRRETIDRKKIRIRFIWDFGFAGQRYGSHRCQMAIRFETRTECFRPSNQRFPETAEDIMLYDI
jgi:hypothetical protein